MTEFECSKCEETYDQLGVMRHDDGAGQWVGHNEEGSLRHVIDGKDICDDCCKKCDTRSPEERKKS